jgi:hypothetical protein
MAFKPRTFLELCMAMKTRAMVNIDGHIGIINGIAVEDGSGFAWIVTILGKGPLVESVFFRE